MTSQMPGIIDSFLKGFAISPSTTGYDACSTSLNIALFFYDIIFAETSAGMSVQAPQRSGLIPSEAQCL